MTRAICMEDLKDLMIEENIDLPETEDRSAYRNYSKNIALTVGFLLGVSDEALMKRLDNPEEYLPIKEALEKKKAEMGLDSKLSEAEKRRIRIRRGFGYSPEEMQEKKKFGFNGMRHIVLLSLIAFITYFIFGTPVIENFIEMFLSLGK